MSQRKKSKRYPDSPSLPDHNDLQIIADFDLAKSQEFERVSITGGSPSEKLIGIIQGRESIISSYSCTDTAIVSVTLLDVFVKDCDFANSHWRSSSGTRLHFSTCRLIGLKANESQLRSVKFSDCQMDFSQLRFSKLAGAWFENCSLKGADFSGSDLSEATFKNCDLSSAFFAAANCKGMDIRSSIVDGLTLGPADFVGAIISPLQAPQIVKVLGLTVLEEEKDLPKGI